MLPITILVIFLVASSSGAPQATWSTSDPNHIVIPRQGRSFQAPLQTPQDNTIQQPSSPNTSEKDDAPISSWTPPQPQPQPEAQEPQEQTGSGPPPTPNKTQIAWCTPIQTTGNDTEPVISYFTQIQPGDIAPPPMNASTTSNSTENGDAKKTPAKPELGSCTPINPDGSDAPAGTPGQLGWFTPVPKPDEVPEKELSPEELSAPGEGVTLGWCTPILENANATTAQLGDCRPYKPATPEDGASSTTSTTTTAKPDKDEETTPAKELLSWYTPHKMEAAPAEGSVIAWFIPVVADIPPPKEPVTKDTKVPSDSDTDKDKTEGDTESGTPTDPAPN